MEDSNEYKLNELEEITFKELVSRIKGYLSYLWSKKKIILAISIFTALVFFALEFVKTSKYTSGISFIINEERNPTSVLEFTEVAIEDYNLNRLLSLARSSRITYETILEPVIILGEKDLLGNHIAKLYNRPIQISTQSLDQLSEEDLESIRVLHELLAGNQLVGKLGFITIDADKSQIITLKAVTTNAELSQILLNTHFNKLKEFYIDQTVGNSKRTLKLLEEREKNLVDQLLLSENNLEDEIAATQAKQFQGLDDRFDVLYDIGGEKQAEIEDLYLEEKNQLEDVITQLKNKILQLNIEILDNNKNKLISQSETNLNELYGAILKEEELFEKQRLIDNLNLRIQKLNTDLEVNVLKQSLAESINVNKIKQYQEVLQKIEVLNSKYQTLGFNKTLDSLHQAISVNEIEGEAWRTQLRKSIDYLFQNNKLELAQMKSKIDSLDAEILASISKLSASAGANSEIGLHLGKEEDEIQKLSELEDKVENLLRMDADAGNYFNEKITSIRFNRLTRDINNIDGIITELRKNRQSLEFNIKYQTPAFEIMDQTIRPIANLPSPLSKGILGFILGIVFSNLFYIAKRTYDIEMAK